jgi:phage tail sheath protein FI
MRIYQTPGVYHETTDASAGGVAPLRTDVAGFVGIAERGPLHLAVPVESYRQFVAWFGDAFDNGYLAYCARGFFENGGRRVWIVRVASAAASAAHHVLVDASGPAWRIEASSPGVWGQRLQVRVVEVRRQRQRARLDPLHPLRLETANLAGFARWDLVELVRGAERARSIVVDINASTGSLWLEEAPKPALAVGALDLRVETLAYTVELYEHGRLLDVVADLSLVPRHPRYGPKVLKMPWQRIDPHAPEAMVSRVPEADLALEYFRIASDRRSTPPPCLVIRELRDAVRRDALEPLRGVAGAALSPRLALLGSADGLAALTVDDFTGSDLPPDASPLQAAAARRGIAALAAVDDIGIVAVPDIQIRPDPRPLYLVPHCEPDSCLPMPPFPPAAPPPIYGDIPPVFDSAAIYTVQAALVRQCETRRDRIALLDAPFNTCSRLSLAAAELRDWRSRFDTPFAALYAPWLKVVDPRRRNGAGRETTRPIPPSGHVAGMIAAIDLRHGVHHAPANVPLEWVQDVTLSLDDERHGLLNAIGIDLVRAVDGRGLRVLGARTLSSDPDWRFLNVRRLVSMIARAIDISIQWAVFEPNDWRTRMKIALVIGSFLRSLWTRGALVGTAIEQAFFVRCDEGNNPPETGELGRLIVDVGVAPVVPFEFIVLRIGRDANGFAVTEQTADRAGA